MANRDVDTIDEVRLRKHLWDASDPLYKNKDARNKGWEDIVVVLFENVSEEEKQQLGKLVQQRWKTARDAYFRTKKSMKNTLSGIAASKYKKYIYFDELSFLSQSNENECDESLNETIPSPSNNMHHCIGITASLDSMVSSENTQGTYMSTHQTSSNTIQEEETDDALNPELSQRPWAQKRKKRPQQTQQKNQESSPFERELLTLLSNQTPDIAADDMAFFSSLGPILKCFDLEQKLEFRSRVLRDAMDIKNYNYRSSSSVSSYSHDVRSPPQQDPYAPGYSGYQTHDTTPGYSGYQTASRENDE